MRMVRKWGKGKTVEREMEGGLKLTLSVSCVSVKTRYTLQSHPARKKLSVYDSPLCVRLWEEKVAETKKTLLFRASLGNSEGLFAACGNFLERVTGVEPVLTGWKPVVMPLYDTRNQT